METPSSSTRRVTRSQTLISGSVNNSNLLLSRKVEGSEMVGTKSWQKNAKTEKQDRSALIDITNDSPIVGLAVGNLETPSSARSKKRIGGQAKYTRTPGSGEALLRGQVKTLLQKVEEEAELSKVTMESRPFFKVQGFIKSPISLLAPTPANTPHVLNSSPNADVLPSVTSSPIEEKILIPKMESEMLDGIESEAIESQNLITRSLLLDFSEKSDSSDRSSVLTYQGKEAGLEKLYTDDDDSSIWSIQVNVSSAREDDDEEEDCLEAECDDCYSYEDEKEETEPYFCTDDGMLDELCEGISKISVDGLPEFQGKHIRFVYNSDDELQGEEEVVGLAPTNFSPSSDILCLKGLPIPEGKHLRFSLESEDNEI